MKLLNIYLEERFKKYNNTYYSQVYDESFWNRYLEVFDSINVVARVEVVRDYTSISNSYKEIKNQSITFTELPYYHGIKSGLLKMPTLVLALLQATLKTDYHILRLPGIISIISGSFLTLLPGKVMAVELVGDPFEVFSTGIGGRLSKVFRMIFTYSTKHLIAKANAVSYVTEYTLQRRYPAHSIAFTTYYSSINLSDDVFKAENIKKQINSNNFNILLVGSIEQKYKGFDLVLKAITYLDFKDNITINIVGDGVYRDSLEKMCKELGVDQNVIFHGKIIQEKVFDLMRRCDLFIMPSRTEGLPRALIEAMAHGLPAIGSDVGGIPELLDSEFIFPSENFLELAKLIRKIYECEDIYSVSKTNFLKSQEYAHSELKKRRRDFYNYIIKLKVK